MVVHSDLIRFIQQPVVHYFKEQLGLTYSDTQNSLPTRAIAMDGNTVATSANP